AGHAVIRPAHLPIFEYIDRDHGSRISYLARHANITAQAMGELVDTLVAHGYVERIPDPEDGRARLVCLTDRGRDIYTDAGRLIRELEAIWSGYLGDERFLHLKELLADLCDAIAEDPASLTGRRAMSSS